MKRLIQRMALAAMAIMPIGAMGQGSESYQFLSITPSAHVYALGGQNITLVSNDISLANQNPALLGQEMSNKLSLNYMRYLGESNLMGATYGIKAGAHGTVGVGLQYFGFGSMKGADESCTLTGDFGVHDVSVGVMYSHDITDRLRGGIGVKMISSSYEQYSAMAISTDLGINYFDPEHELSLSVVVKNLGGQVKKFDNTSDKLPWDIQLGWSQYLKNTPIRLSVTAYNLPRWKSPYYKTSHESGEAPEYYTPKFVSNLFRHLVIGAEYAPSEKFFIGIGYNYKTRSDMSTYARNFVSGFSVGAGINVKAVGASVAIAQPHTGATTFMLNLSLNIGEFINR
ncbi:MAG: type IX secretion system protein PorQ, partial [Muribaculaceae bacterium]|nr:type IX secretion system protein PorQ [Muribaculaceae bacterium]